MPRSKGPPKPLNKYTTPVIICGERVNLSEVHRQTGISIATLSRIFAGQRAPSFRILVAIKSKMRAGADQLIGELVERQKQWKEKKKLFG